MKAALLELIRQKRRTLIVLGVLLGLTVLLSLVNRFYLEPAVIASQASWNELRQKVAAAGKADVETIYRRGVDDLKKMEALVPLKRQFPRVLGELLDSAASNGLSTGAVSYKPQVVKGQSDMLVYGLSMSVSGSYAAVKSFLADLQQFEEIVVIDGISLTNGDPYEENVVLDVKASIYLRNREGA